MARDRGQEATPPEAVISIIGPGMRVVGDCETAGTLRIEGAVEGAPLWCSEGAVLLLGV